jgi:hypothetical protein
MLHRDDDISLFVALIDISVSFGRLFQRIATIYDGFQPTLLIKFFEKIQMFCAYECIPANDFLACYQQVEWP